jgi:para-nitrobenzyl esterase
MKPDAGTRPLFKLFIGAALLATACTASAGTDVVPTDAGWVRGFTTSAGIDEFLGIPYAQAPVGALRWRPPQPHAKWAGVRDATRFGSRCPQVGFQASTDEDCLSVNVFRRHRQEREDQPRSVMVWIHGGGFVNNASDAYDPTRMVSQGDVIVVTLNYRLGALGFLAHPALDAEGHFAANYGLMDQQLALHWVQRNAAAFGGDPRRVTLFGESAGGASVFMQMASPSAAGLFHRAISESGGPTSMPLPTVQDMEPAGQAFAAGAGCTDQSASCLRRLSVQQILANQQVPIPVVDGQLLPQSLPAAFASGQFNHVPLMVGTNHDEFRLFVAAGFDLAGGPITAAQYPELVAQTAPPPLVQPILAQYPLGAYPSPDLAFAALNTDAGFSCPSRTTRQQLAAQVPVFGYEFVDPNAPNFSLPPVSFPYGAAHASELQFLFDFFPGGVPITPAPLSADERTLADKMIGYWTNFAKRGHPNGAHLPTWPAYQSASDDTQQLAPPQPSTRFDFALDHQCAFWDPILNPTPTAMSTRR